LAEQRRLQSLEAQRQRRSSSWGWW
jgi:hypothetical protein